VLHFEAAENALQRAGLWCSSHLTSHGKPRRLIRNVNTRTSTM
jgi:hypothetical protein